MNLLYIATPWGKRNLMKIINSLNIHMKKLILLCALLSIMFTSNAFANDQAFQFGIAATFSPSLACVTFQGEELKPGQTIHVIVFDPQRWTRGKVVNLRETPCKLEAFLDGTSYDIQLEQAASVRGELGVAVIASEVLLKIEDKEVILTNHLNNHSVKFSRCASLEGLHFLARQGSKRLWHEYYYLGYDIKPTCSEEERKE